MIPACKLVEDMICYEHESTIKYKMIGVPSKQMKQRALGIIKDKLIIRISGNLFNYTRQNGKVELIKTKENPSCSCVLYFDKAICHHFIAACILDDVKIPGCKKVGYYFFNLRLLMY